MKTPSRKPVDRINILLQEGLGKNIRQIALYRQVMQNPTSAFTNLVYRPYAIEILENLLNYALNDVPTFNRLRQLLLQEKRHIRPKAYESLENKSEKSGIDIETLIEVYFKGIENEGYDHLTEEQKGFNNVNSYIANQTKYVNPTIRTIKKVIKEQ